MPDKDKKSVLLLDAKQLGLVPDELTLKGFDEKLKADPEFAKGLYSGFNKTKYGREVLSETPFREITGYDPLEAGFAVTEERPALGGGTTAKASIPAKTPNPINEKPGALLEQVLASEPQPVVSSSNVPGIETPAIFSDNERPTEDFNTQMAIRYNTQTRFGGAPMLEDFEVKKYDIPFMGKLYDVPAETKVAFGEINKQLRAQTKIISELSPKTKTQFFEKGEMQRFDAANDLTRDMVSRKQEAQAKAAELDGLRNRAIQDVSFKIAAGLYKQNPELATRNILSDLAKTEGKNFLPNYEKQAIIDELGQKIASESDPKIKAKYRSLQQEAYSGIRPEQFAYTDDQGNRIIDLTPAVNATKAKYAKTDRASLKDLLVKKYSDLQAYKALLTPEIKGAEVVQTSIGDHNELFAGNPTYNKLYAEVLGIADALAYNKNLFQMVEKEWQKPENLSGTDALLWEAKKKVNIFSEAFRKGTNAGMLMESMFSDKLSKEERASGLQSALGEDPVLDMTMGDLKAMESFAPTFADNMAMMLGESLPYSLETVPAMAVGQGVLNVLGKAAKTGGALAPIENAFLRVFKDPKSAAYARALTGDLLVAAAAYEATGQGAATGLGETAFGAAFEAISRKMPIMGVFGRPLIGRGIGRPLIGRGIGRLATKTGEEIIEEKVGENFLAAYNQVFDATDAKTLYEEQMGKNLSKGEENLMLATQCLLMAAPGTFFQILNAVKRYGYTGSVEDARATEEIVEEKKNATEAVNAALKAKVEANKPPAEPPAGGQEIVVEGIGKPAPQTNETVVLPMEVLDKGTQAEGDVITAKGKMEGVVTDYVESADARIALPEKGYLISGVSLNEGEEKGIGSGQEIYKKALDEHGILYSSFPISEDAMRVQDKLVEKGIAKIETITLSDGTELRKITKQDQTTPAEQKPANEQKGGRVTKQLDALRESNEYADPTEGDDFLSALDDTTPLVQVNAMLDEFAQGNMLTPEQVQGGIDLVDNLILGVPSQSNMSKAQKASYLDALDNARLDMLAVQNKQLAQVVSQEEATAPPIQTEVQTTNTPEAVAVEATAPATEAVIAENVQTTSEASAPQAEAKEGSRTTAQEVKDKVVGSGVGGDVELSKAKLNYHVSKSPQGVQGEVRFGDGLHGKGFYTASDKSKVPFSGDSEQFLILSKKPFEENWRNNYRDKGVNDDMRTETLLSQGYDTIKTGDYEVAIGNPKQVIKIEKGTTYNDILKQATEYFGNEKEAADYLKSKGVEQSLPTQEVKAEQVPALRDVDSTAKKIVGESAFDKLKKEGYAIEKGEFDSDAYASFFGTHTGVQASEFEKAGLRLIKPSEKIKVYRGKGKNVAEGENEGVTWVAEDKKVAENYSGDGQVEEIEVSKPKNPFPNPTDTIHVKGSDVGNKLRLVRDRLFKEGKLTKEQALEASKLIDEFVSAAGEESELYSTKTNKKGVSSKYVKALQALGFDGIVQKESYNSGSPFTATKTGNETNTYGIFKSESLLSKEQAPESGSNSAVQSAESKEGFTEGKDLNKIFTELKAKFGDKKGSTLYDTAIRLVNPNKNTIVEIRDNGVVVKEGETYTLKPFGNTDANPKQWTLYKGLDVTDQFVNNEAPESGSNPAVQNNESGVKQQIEDFGVAPDMVEPVRSVIGKVFEGLKKAGLTTSKTVGEWVGIGKGTEKPYSLKIDGKDVQVKNVQPEVVNGFYSPLEKIIGESKFEKLPAKQWADKFGKSEEAKWTGLSDWLAQQQGSVSKADIQKYLKDNRIEIVEVVKGEPQKEIIPLSKIKWEEVDEDSDLYGDYEYVSSDGKYRVAEYSDGTKVLFDNEDVSISKIKSIKEDVEVDKDNTETKFQQYQLEGEKENYKEVLVTMPVAKSKQEYVVEQDYRTPNTFYAVNQKTGVKLKFGSYELAKSQAERLSKEAQPDFDKQFKSSHFDEPNILVHLRMNTRTDVEGNKVLFLEEVQSDWGQKGKKEGFRGELKMSAKNTSQNRYDVFENGRLIRANVFAQTEQRAIDYVTNNPNEAVSNSLKVPTAPFVTDTNAWTKLGLKVALKEAVKQGADKIAWTTGEQQNERYDLSKTIKSIDAKIDGTAASDNSPIYKITSKYKSGGETSGSYRQDELEGVLGKELAEKIINNKGGKYEGVDLQVGGKGMKGFYGSPTEGSLGIVGNVAKSLFKQEVKTATLGEVKTLSERAEIEENRKGLFNIYDRKSSPIPLFKDIATREEAERLLNKPIKNESTQHSIDITPELKASAEGGQPLFKDAEAQYRIENGKNIVEAIKDFDGTPEATVALTHEIMHPTVVAIIDGAKEGNEVGARHIKTIVDEFNKANPNNKVTTEELIEGNDAFKQGSTADKYRAVQEFIADSWEKYHTEGAKGFSKAFQEVLDQITEAFRAVYKSVTGKDLTPELRKMFDEILGKETKPASEQKGGRFPTQSSPTPKSQTKEQKRARQVVNIIAQTLKNLFSDVLILTGSDWNQSLDAAMQELGIDPTQASIIFNKEGDATGFVFGSTVYLNGDVLTGKSALTEFSHVFLAHMKRVSPELYQKGIDLVKDSSYFSKVKRSAFYKEQLKALGLTGQAAEDFLAEEALTEAIADGGQAIMNQNTGTLAALKTFIADMWQMIKDAFQLNTWQDMGKLQNLTLDDYAQIVANTMLSGEQIVGEEVQIGKPLFQVTGDVSEEERFGVDFNADVRAKLAPLTTTLTAGTSITPELENALAGVLNTKDPGIAEAEKQFVNNLIGDIQKALATSSKPTAQVLKEEMQKGEAKFAAEFKGEDIKQFYALTVPIGEVVKESMLDTVTERVGGNGKVGTVVGEVLDAVRSSAKKISEVRGQRKQALADRKLSGNKPSVIGGYSAKGWAQGGKVARAVASPVSKFFAEEVSAMSDFFDFFGARYVKKIMPFLDRKITSLFPNADKTAIAKKLRNMAATGNFAARAVERLASSLVFGAAKTADQVRENEYKNGLTRLGQLLSNNLVDLLNAVLYDPSLQIGSVPGYSEEELRQMAIQQSRARVYVALNPSVLQIMTFDEFDALAGKRIKRWADYSDTTKQDKYKEYRETVHNQAAKLGITYNKGRNTPNFGIADLTPSEQEAMKIVRNVMDLVHDISFITGNLGFGTYINNVDNYMPRLIDLKEENTNDPEYEKFMRGVPENTGMVLGIYNKRADEMDAFIQLNTIMDAAMAAKVRVQQVFKNKAINDYAQFVVDESGINNPALANPSLAGMVSSEKKPGFVKLPVAGFGALNGKYVAAPIADDLRGFMYFTDSQQSWLSKTLNKLGNAFEAYDSNSFRQFLRLKNTVLNPRVAVANFTTGLTMASIAGINPLTQMKFFSKLFSDGKESLLTSDLYARLVAKGLLGNGISYVDFFKRGEDKLTLAKDEALLDAYRAGTLGDKDFREMILALMNENVLAEAYAMTDEYHKAAAFLALREMGQSEDVAIETVKKQFQNMERVAPLFARISKTPGMNMFFRWAYQSKYIMTNGLRNHPLTTVATMTAMMAIPGILSNLIGEDEDKKTLREGKGSAGNFFGMRIPGQWTYMLDGVQKVADMGRFFLLDRLYETETDDKGAINSFLESMDPTGFTKLGYYDWLTTFGEKTPASALNKYDRPSPIDKDSFFEWLNSASKDPVVNVITQVVFGMDFNNRDLVNAGVSDKFGLKKINTNSIGAELFPRVAHLLRQIVPAVSDLQDIYFAMNGESDYYGRWKTPTDAALGLVGLKVQTVNDKTLQQQATRILDTYARSFKELGKQANAEFKQADKALEKVDNIVLSFSQDTNIDPAELDKRIKQKSESAIKEYERSISRAQAVRAEQIAVFEGLLNTYRIIDRLHWYEVTEGVLSANKLSGASGEAALMRELEDVKELVVELQKAGEALKTKERKQEIEETVRENVTRQLKQ